MADCIFHGYSGSAGPCPECVRDNPGVWQRGGEPLTEGDAREIGCQNKELEGGRVVAQKIEGTEQDKEPALAALQERRENRPKRIHNESLYAGSPMYYYCQSCGHLADTLPESHPGIIPKKLCAECQALKDRSWLE